MSEMVERVAKHIYDGSTADYHDLTMTACRSMALIAIEAMREPTEEMLDALNVRHRREVSRREIGKDYTTMIDIALKEE